ncbi:MAG: hypothetical protein J6U20_03830 [Fibrobacter sp.]|nr:hypothetical protein [Fibrobacter sp.]
MATYNNDDYASKGVGTAGLTLGVIGTALASGILNGNGLGGLFGNNPNQNPTSSPIYQLSAKDTEIAQLKAEKHADDKFFALSERMANVEARVLTIEKTEPLRDQIIGERVANLQRVLDGIARPFVPNYAVAPGWGPAFVSPFPPVAPIVNSGTGSTPATTSNGTTTAQAA